MITKKKKSKSDISNLSEAFWDKITGFTDEPVVQCNAPTIKYTSLEDSGNDDRK